MPLIYQLAATVVVIAGLRLAGGLIVPVIFGIFLAVVSFPIMTGLERRKVPHPLAVAITVGLNIGIVILILYFGSRFVSIVEPREVAALAERIVGLTVEGAEWLEGQGVEGAAEKWTEFIQSKQWPIPENVQIGPAQPEQPQELLEICPPLFCIL